MMQGNKKTFYELILKYNKNHGVLIAPEGTDSRFGEDVLPVKDWENIVFKLDKGIYLPFMNSNTVAYFANKELKQLIEENIPQNYPLELLPIETHSRQYGKRIYYLIHFTKIFEITDKENSIRIPETNSIVKPYIDYEKAKDLDFFNSDIYINEIIVSDKIKKLMKKHKLDTGIKFKEVPYVL